MHATAAEIVHRKLIKGWTRYESWHRRQGRQKLSTWGVRTMIMQRKEHQIGIAPLPSDSLEPQTPPAL
jgi:hypothetical protein